MNKPEFQTFNNILTEITRSDVVIGVSRGQTKVIKNRSGSIEDVSKLEAINMLVSSITPLTGVDFFDEATARELTLAIVSILDKHKVDFQIGERV